MCGIVGILGTEAVAARLIEGLSRLEYRGYDSAGIATLEGGKLMRLRAPGKLHNLKAQLKAAPLQGTIGIGHTRWATHGAPTEMNAHPHATEAVAVVHNGIIENYRELRQALEEDGANFQTETDTEVVAHLVTQELKKGKTPLQAVNAAVRRLRGAFALGFIFDKEENLMIGARRGSPLAVGFGHGANYLGSDAIALAPFTTEASYLEEGDVVVLTRESVEFYNESGKKVTRKKVKVDGSEQASKGSYRHFMLKEIFEQPDVVGRTLSSLVDMVGERVRLPQGLPFSFNDLSRITICACGTAYYAGLVAKYWFEHFARLPVDIDVASEFRYREAPLRKGDLMLVVSQSGETADTLAALRYAKVHGQHTLAVVNVPTSTMARESECMVRTVAGPEIGVASTKAFTCQLAVLAALAIAAGRARGFVSREEERALVRELVSAPNFLREALSHEQEIAQLAHELSTAKDTLFLGRGTNYPLALEGALKLKEISYLHAEGYAAGELKHGPIALIDEAVPTIVIAPHDRWFEKTMSNVQEVMARKGRVILFTDTNGMPEMDPRIASVVAVPKTPELIAPMVFAVLVQLLAYHVALRKGTDVDQPRNLAKSVTVE
jgi:glucosamine--fructose-6-phosphate aminotransferase (isomerizing)